MNPIYVPIVKGKVNDLIGLGLVSNDIRSRIKPFVEAMPVSPQRPSVDEHLYRFCNYIRRHVPLGSMFVDFYGIMPDALTSHGENAVLAGYQLLKGMGRKVTPAYGLERNDDIWPHLAAIAAYENEGFCLRLSQDDLTYYAADELWESILERTAQIKLRANQVDLLLDLGSVSEENKHVFREMVTTFLAENPGAKEYRTLILAGSCALRHVGGVEVDGQADVSRSELHLWSELWQDLPTSIQPIYSDYGVVHPNFSDQGPNKYMNAKIRYTAGDKIIYHRGHGLLHPKKDFVQYHGLAARASSEPRYLRPSYSAGDAYIAECAAQIRGPGLPADWVRVDMNHHITYTTNQMVRLRTQLLEVTDEAEIEPLLSNVE